MHAYGNQRRRFHQCCLGDAAGDAKRCEEEQPDADFDVPVRLDGGGKREWRALYSGVQGLAIHLAATDYIRATKTARYFRLRGIDGV